jgi:uncharacterized protein YjdB
MSGKTISRSSVNTKVATVSTAGVLTLAGVGATTLSASADSLTTTVPVTSVSIAPASASLAIGDSTTLSAVAKDSHRARRYPVPR